MQRTAPLDLFRVVVDLGRTVRRQGLSVVVMGLLASAPTSSWAQLLIGQSSGVTGPVAAGVKENIDGAQVYFKHINSRGGVNGQRIELVTLDDKFDAKLTAENPIKSN